MFEEWNLTNTRIDTNTQNIQTYDHVYILLVNIYILNISIKNARFWLKSRIDGFEILNGFKCNRIHRFRRFKDL